MIPLQTLYVRFVVPPHLRYKVVAIKGPVSVIVKFTDFDNFATFNLVTLLVFGFNINASPFATHILARIVCFIEYGVSPA